MRKILVIDDDSIMRQVVKHALSKKYLIFDASCIREADEILSVQNIDLIILDIFMPETDGFSFLNTIKQSPEYSEIPVILFTGNDEHELENKGYTSGAVDYIRKPCNIEVLRIRVDAALKNDFMRKLAAKKCSSDLYKDQIDEMRDMLEYYLLNKAKGSEIYLKTKEIAKEFDISSPQAARRISELAQNSLYLDIEVWSNSNSVVWKIKTKERK